MSCVEFDGGKFTRKREHNPLKNGRVCEFGMFDYGHIYIWPPNNEDMWIAQLNEEEFDEFAEWIAEVKKKKDAGEVFINEWGQPYE